MNGVSYYLSRFPESMYPPVENHQEYGTRIIDGYTRLRDSKIIVAALARDIQSNLHHFIARVEHLVSHANDYMVVIFENDSVDDTAKLLKLWSKEDQKVFVMSQAEGYPRLIQDTSPSRCAYMAYLRNNLLAIIRSHLKNFEADRIMIMDSDLRGGFSFEGVCHSFSFDSDYLIGSNGLIYIRNQEDEKKMRRVFYDTWAYRRLGHPQEHSSEEINLLRYDRGQDLVEVDSCFGGMMIYPTAALEEDVCYKEDDCDHVTLHRQLTEKGYQIFLNPNMITLYSSSYYNLYERYE